MEPSETGRRMGHEVIGVVEDVGADVRTLKLGDLVVDAVRFSDGTCVFCREGLHTSCVHGGFFGSDGVDGGQGEAVRVPQADGTLFALPVGEDDALMPSLLTLSDVMGTGHHAASPRGSAPAGRVAVVGDGAVGLCGVIAARRLGAEQIIVLGRHPDRIALAKAFGATDVVSERGDEAVERVRELTGRLRRPLRPRVRRPRASRRPPRSASPARAARSAASASRRTSRCPASLPTFFDNVTIGGGPAPARAYIEELLPDVLEGRIEPGRVFDRVGRPRRRARRLPGDERPRGDQGDGRTLRLRAPNETKHGLPRRAESARGHSVRSS